MYIFIVCHRISITVKDHTNYWWIILRISGIMSTQMAGQHLFFSTLDNIKCVQVLWINSNWSRKIWRVDRGLAATVHLCTLNTRVHSAFLNGFCSLFIGICYSSSLVHGIAIATASLWQMHCYNTTQGKHTTQFASVFETVSVSAIRSVRHRKALYWP